MPVRGRGVAVGVVRPRPLMNTYAMALTMRKPMATLICRSGSWPERFFGEASKHVLRRIQRPRRQGEI